MQIDGTHLFGLPAGVDFGTAVINGLDARMAGQPPEALARVTVYVNTRRMQRRLREVYAQGPARLLPKIRLITDLAMDPTNSALPPPISPLRRRLELAQLVAALLDQQPDLAPRAALFDLADSLAALIDEMQGEGVSPDTLSNLDVTDQSGHWQRALQFLDIIQTTYTADQTSPDREARQRQVIESLAADWATTPPSDPIIVAGSTGSRGATGILLEAVAKLPQGAVILPGYDFDMPPDVWARLEDGLTAEDHPQTRFHKLMKRLDLTKDDVGTWDAAPAKNPHRNALVSLALRPAPVTNQWLTDGPNLKDLLPATQDLTLVEAPSTRIEAEAIALRLRAAVDEGITAAVITPDRTLTRQIAAALDRWHITPDDSAGQPLPLSPPGRFLRQTAALFGAALTGEALLSLLKHPLCNTGADRSTHLLHTRELELSLRRYGPPFPTAQTFIDWALKTGDKHPGRMEWAQWLGACLAGVATADSLPLTDHITRHITLTERLSAGPSGGTGTLWDEAAGRKAKQVTDDLALQADAGGILSPLEYTALLNTVLGGAEVRNPDNGDPQILIWGTLEARVQSADLVILAGLNEGSWPEAPKPDPWLNRTMRAKAGLLLPERRIGLSAHDFAQGIAGAEVWITRSVRSDDAQTVPSRWINRLTNLLSGLPEQDGPVALAAMQSRGQTWINRAIRLSDTDPVDPAQRPSPRPPVDHRPKQLSVTGVTKLIRDPYDIYASKILRLSALDPLSPAPDAPLRGTVFHKVLEQFIKTCPDPASPDARDHLITTAQQVLATDCPWPTNRVLWQTQIEGLADWFIEGEIKRQQTATPHKTEIKGQAQLTTPEFTLTCTADRVDLTPDWAVVIYDYKTGKPPSAKEQKVFEKQLLLETAIAEQGGFADLEPSHVQAAHYIGIGTNKSIVDAPLTEQSPKEVWEQLQKLVTEWQDPARGYTARLAPQFLKYNSDYDHLSRLGEWDDSKEPSPKDVP